MHLRWVSAGCNQFLKVTKDMAWRSQIHRSETLLTWENFHKISHQLFMKAFCHFLTELMCKFQSSHTQVHARMHVILWVTLWWLCFIRTAELLWILYNVWTKLHSWCQEFFFLSFTSHIFLQRQEIHLGASLYKELKARETLAGPQSKYIGILSPKKEYTYFGFTQHTQREMYNKIISFQGIWKYAKYSLSEWKTLKINWWK